MTAAGSQVKTPSPMSFYVQGILKSLLLEAQIGLLLFDRVLRRSLPGRAQVGLSHSRRADGARLVQLREPARQLRAGARVGAIPLLPGRQVPERGRLVRPLQGGDAGRPRDAPRDQLAHPRDIHTFELQPMEQAMVDGPRVRAHFSDARWEEFKRDWVKMVTNRPIDCRPGGDRPRQLQLAGLVGDRPPDRRAVAAHPRLADRASGWLDMALMLVMCLLHLPHLRRAHRLHRDSGVGHPRHRLRLPGRQLPPLGLAVQPRHGGRAS